MHQPKQTPGSSLVEARLRKIKDLEEMGVPVYTVGFSPDTRSGDFKERFDGNAGPAPGEDVVAMCGRILALRIMGKASFIRIRDEQGDFQAYVARDTVGKEAYKLVKKLDVGDIIGVRGRPFKTRTGELSVMADEFVMLTKSLHPLPEKWHGLTDVETRFRQRYIDLIVNPAARDVVRVRSRITGFLRSFMMERGFLEVETPMMQPIPGGATAKPFVTYHHSLDRNLYLRIAPELYLKRLLVGGFEKVFEINRNFRNEGLSTQHNPEFTMMEFYEAYATYEDLMSLTEEMLTALVREVRGSLTIRYGAGEVDFSPPWERLTVSEALARHTDLTDDDVRDAETLRRKARSLDLDVTDEDSVGKLQMEIFDQVVEERLWGPIFIHKYPVEVSPLARRSEDDPSLTDRFELYICGREIANAFTELTDPFDQRRRFEEQVRARDAGDEEAHFLDEDFLTALEYGMPPAAGEGIGIDRLVMLLTDSASIREVITFPHMRPKTVVE